MKKRIFAFTMALICMLAVMATANANSAEPPCFTIMVINPPEDLELYVQFPNVEPIKLTRISRSWESYYRFYYSDMASSGVQELSDGALVVKANGESFTCMLEEIGRHYNTLYTLDIAEKAAKIGQPAWRTPVLVGMRVILTLLVEAVVFFLLGYRKKLSWILFFAINLLTQGYLNAMITGPTISGYWIIGFILLEILIFIVEMAAFAIFVRERKWYIGLAHGFAANALSLILGVALLSNLPI